MLVRRWLPALYALSGAAALLYEVVWIRLISLHMGRTEAGLSTVLAAFMGGLALGAALAGRYTGRLTPTLALKVYAGLEGLVAITALLLPTLLALVGPWLVTSYANGDGGTWFGTVRLVSSLGLLLVPTTALGATLPLAVRALEGDQTAEAGRAGWLYAANTVGAAVGAAASGLILIPRLGLQSTTLLGVIASLVAAAGAVVLASDRFAEASSAPSPDPRSKPRPSRTAPALRPRFWTAGVALAASGLVALVFEVAWTRILILALGPTAYATSAMLTAFILGLALGAAGGAWLVTRVPNPLVAFGLSEILAGSCAAMAALTVPRLHLRIARLVAEPGATFGSVVWNETLWAGVLLLPMATALGCAFPLALGAALPGRSDGADDVAGLYTLNTVGAIAGALAGGFLFIPLLGLQATVTAAAALAVGTGLILVALANEASVRARVPITVLGILTLAGTMLQPTWSERLLSSGAYKYAPQVVQPDLETGLEAGTLLYYEEGAAGTVSVRRLAGITSLAINGKVDASNGADMLTQKLLAHVPLLLHPAPKDVAIVGLGSAVTLGAALRHPIARADAIEISPEVVEASSLFASENHGALSDPRATITLGDGRTHMRLATRQYDVIISEPSNPWMAGVASLFTRDFFASVRDRLKPDGVFCQWAHTYDIGAADLRSIVATFSSVFPDGQVWLVGEGDILLLGGPGPIEPLLRNVVDQWDRPGVAGDLAEVEVRSPYALLSQWLGGPDLLARYGGDAIVQTDDWMPLEFSAPRSIFGRARDDNVSALVAMAADSPKPEVVTGVLGTATPELRRQRATMLFRSGAVEAALDEFGEVARLAPTDERTLSGLVDAAAAAHRPEEALKALRQIAATQGDNATVRRILSRALAADGQPQEGLELARQAAALAPADPGGLVQSASILADLGDADGLAEVVNALHSRFPDLVDTAYYAASLHFLRGELPEAIAEAERVVQLDGSQARAFNLLGAAHASLGDRDRARAAFQASLRGNPRDPASYTNYGYFELEGANAEAAAVLFSEALSLDPASERATKGLIAAYRQLGQEDRALSVEGRGNGRSSPASP